MDFLQQTTKEVVVRTNRDKIIIQELQGCNDIIDEIKLPAGLVPWSHGGYYNERSEFKRLQGKQALATSTSSRGMILTLAHVQFKSQDYLILHDNETYSAVDSVDLNPLRSQEESVDPLNPFI